MTQAADLWTSVVAAYDSGGLISLTNIRDRSATAVNTTTGQNAAQEVIDLWPAFAQVAYDDTDALHVAVARQGVIAVLWRRGGSASTIEQVKWDEVFGDDGLLAKVRRTGARGRVSPLTNSGLSSSPDQTSDGRTVRPWSDPDSFPTGTLPLRRTVDFG